MSEESMSQKEEGAFPWECARVGEFKEKKTLGKSMWVLAEPGTFEKVFG